MVTVLEAEWDSLTVCVYGLDGDRVTTTEWEKVTRWVVVGVAVPVIVTLSLCVFVDEERSLSVLFS
jgi:hypothetical protein